MTLFLLTSSIVLWLIVLLLSVLLLGALRNLALLRWRLEQLEATTPKRIGRDGLKRGKRAPDFTLPSAAGPEVSLHDFAGRKVLLVFTQSGCGPCQAIMPELNRLVGRRGEAQVLVVNNGDIATSHKWSAELRPRFPLLTQEHHSISKRYEVFATPFAFLIDEQGLICSKGIINNKQHIGFVLTTAGAADRHGQDEPEPAKVETVEV